LNFIRPFFLMTLIAVLPFLAWAHGGEDHGSEAGSAPSTATAPRAVAQSEDFELVAALEGKNLMLTLDRFSTNEPVSAAQIELESGALKMTATEVAPGVYSVPAEAFVNPGKYPFAIAVQAGELSDLLTTALEVPAAAVSAGQNKPWNPWLVGGGSTALLVVGAGLIAVRRRHNHAADWDKL
jgi:hypothetical protein